MTGLIFILLVALLPTLGFLVGARMGGGDDKRLTNPEKKELNRLRRFEADALGLAYEHTAYNDPLAIKIISLRSKELE